MPNRDLRQQEEHEAEQADLDAKIAQQYRHRPQPTCSAAVLMDGARRDVTIENPRGELTRRHDSRYQLDIRTDWLTVRVILTDLDAYYLRKELECVPVPTTYPDAN